MTDNVELFSDVAAALFLRLYSSFPVPVDIEVDLLGEQAMGDDEPEGATPDAFVEASMHWLGAAGIIAFEPGQMGARMIERVSLTGRGFLALQAPNRLGEPIGRSLGSTERREDRRNLIGLALAAAR